MRGTGLWVILRERMVPQMINMFNNACGGWEYYISNGKFPALLMAVLLYFYLFVNIKGKYKGTLQEKTLMDYTMVMTIMCVLPFTAALLMYYQTGFYDYYWLWSFVPQTIVIAWGIVLFAGDREKEFRSKSGNYYFKFICLVLGLIFIVAAAGNFVAVKNSGEHFRNYGNEDRELVEYIEESMDEVVLWAPGDILETARMYSGHIKLLYGRNMWDESLNAYSYDLYDDCLVSLYEWMEAPVFEDEASVKAYVDTAKMYGVNTIVLPSDCSEENIETFEKITKVPSIRKQGCYFFFIGDTNE